MPAVLGYWDIRGLAHAIRLLLEYTNTPYEDKKYCASGEGPDYDISQWTNEKEKLGLDFPNRRGRERGDVTCLRTHSKPVAEEKLKLEYLEELPGKLKLFSQFLGDRKWFAGEKLTYVDFLAYDVLDQHRMFAPKCLDQLKNLKDFLDRFEALEKIAAYMSSGRYMKAPVFWRTAQWSNRKE
ncbi:glutathione S-transferase 2-like isoform X5 [Lepidochelys kempii]|uniref:glutathione S-transferase 2-like isoform X5 n=1 Tax=Lepidochelys kempii TaxID=8472 RepID=UPI003C7059F9